MHKCYQASRHGCVCYWKSLSNSAKSLCHVTWLVILWLLHASSVFLWIIVFLCVLIIVCICFLFLTDCCPCLVQQIYRTPCLGDKIFLQANPSSVSWLPCRHRMAAPSTHPLWTIAKMLSPSLKMIQVGYWCVCVFFYIAGKDGSLKNKGLLHVTISKLKLLWLHLFYFYVTKKNSDAQGFNLTLKWTNKLLLWVLTFCCDFATF